MRRGLGFHARRSPGGFNPLSLFAGGINGAWYDPSDATTLFSDRAGTTPCATPGAGAVVPVGAMLDKRASGYSVFFDGDGDYLSTPDSLALRMGTGDFSIEFWLYFVSIGDYQTPFDKGYTSPGGLVVQTGNGTGRMIVYANGAAVISESGTGVTGTWIHYALVRSGTTLTLYRDGVASGTVTNSTDFNNAATFTVGSPISNTTYAVNGYISNFRVVKGTAVYTGNFTPSGPLSPISGTSLLTCGTSWSGNPAITKNGDARVDGLNPFLASPVGNHAIAANDTTARPELSARVNLLLNTDTLSTQSVTTQATSYTLRFTGTGSIALSGTGSGTYSAGSNSVTCTAGTLTLTVSGTVTNADLRPTNIGSQIPAYQRVVTATDYDSAGFPRRLVFNGTSSAMSTPANVNLSGTDKATVFAGVRKLSDAAAGVLTEFTADINGNNGSFIVTAPSGAGGANYLFGSKGTIRVDATGTATFAAPVSSVVCGIGDIAGDVATLRVNGSQNATNTANQGTGNYANAQLFIGSRNNASLFLNGDIYSLIVVGSAVSAGSISSTETWVNGKTGGVY